MRRKIYRPITREGEAIAGNIHLSEVRRFNFSDVFRNPENIGTYVDEVRRYEVIADYFWENAKFRLRDSEINIKYIKETKSRLSEIKQMPKLSLEAQMLCSQLIDKIEKSFGPK